MGVSEKGNIRMSGLYIRKKIVSYAENFSTDVRGISIDSVDVF